MRNRLRLIVYSMNYILYSQEFARFKFYFGVSWQFPFPLIQSAINTDLRSWQTMSHFIVIDNHIAHFIVVLWLFCSVPVVR